MDGDDDDDDDGGDDGGGGGGGDDDDDVSIKRYSVRNVKHFYQTELKKIWKEEMII
jgi:hypothetical protein